jgi:hypothetical protein
VEFGQSLVELLPPELLEHAEIDAFAADRVGLVGEELIDSQNPLGVSEVEHCFLAFPGFVFLLFPLGKVELGHPFFHKVDTPVVAIGVAFEEAGVAIDGHPLNPQREQPSKCAFLRQSLQKVKMLGKPNILQQFFFKVQWQFLDHLLLFLVLHLELNFPDEFEEIIDSSSDIAVDCLQLHEIVETYDVVFVKDAPLSVGVHDLDEDLGYVGGEHHEEDHH